MFVWFQLHLSHNNNRVQSVFIFLLVKVSLSSTLILAALALHSISNEWMEWRKVGQQGALYSANTYVALSRRQCRTENLFLGVVRPVPLIYYCLCIYLFWGENFRLLCSLNYCLRSFRDQEWLYLDLTGCKKFADCWAEFHCIQSCCINLLIHNH